MTKLKVRARAVDMLGRQQIAGIPTAIHELFKNAHDAYAERVEADFFRRTRVLVLRDDGYGMTRDDVENRWLTLGTESRFNANRVDNAKPDDADLFDLKTWTGPKNLTRRVIMGEKGIGRLAIAVIAPITLLMTRAVRPDGLHDLVVALVHWGLFEQPGLDIGAIDVPIREFSGGRLPTREDVGELIEHVHQNIEELRPELDPVAYGRLLEELGRVKAIGPDRLDAMLNQDRDEPLSLSRNGYGTHFILLPVAPELDDDVDGGADKDASKLERNLLGFSNTMGGEQPVISTEFRDHHLSDRPQNLIGSANFFTPKEYATTDHHFEGDFDEHGQFVGTVMVYGNSRPFICNWAEGRGRPTRCGPFSVRYAYVMGRPTETTLGPDDFSSIISKLDRIGGLYIYRNGIRVLPYGNSDYDFLDIERRRSKSAGDWFFSYRRGFGYVSITHARNGSLSEKAGREGFRENQAYRDFRSILVNFFQQLALEFFRETGPQGDSYWEKKKELTAQAEILAKERKKADNRRNEFKKTLKSFFDAYEDGQFEVEANTLRNNLRVALDQLEEESDDGELAVKTRNLEIDIRSRLRTLSNKASISRPRGLTLTKTLEKDWASYERLTTQLRDQLLTPLHEDIDRMLREATEGKLAEAQRREAALQVLEAERDSVVRELTALRRETFYAGETMNQTMKAVVREQFAEFRETIERSVADFTRRSAEMPEELDTARAEVEQRIVEIREREASLLASIRRQMDDIAEGLKARETTDDRFAALEQRNQVLEEQLDFYADFAQMGMAVGILQHEFEKAAKGMRVSMGELRPWAKGTPALGAIYNELREHFDHIDGYLNVLDPLGRRLRRSTTMLSGEELLKPLRNIFADSLEEHSIHLEATDAFRALKVECRSSAVLGAFINVVDNAIYWVAQGTRGEGRIRLDADEHGFLISNNGPGIDERLRERIFDFGESTKSGGRGMGLPVSRDALRREGFDLELTQAGRDIEPVFRINIVGTPHEEGQPHE